MGNSYLSLSDRGENSPWMYVGSVFLILTMWQLVGGMFIMIPLFYTLFDGDPGTYFDMETTRFEGIDPLISYITLNISFVFFLIGIIMAIKLLHRRKLMTLVTPNEKINIKKIVFGFTLYGTLVLLGVIADYLAAPGTYEFSLNLKKFLIGLPFILVLTPIQTTTEELFFRGYILQGFARITKNAIFLSLISAFIFMVPHLLNPEVFKSTSLGIFQAFSGIIYYFIVGFILSIITVKTHSLEVAIGAHAANNLFAALIVGYKDSALQTETLFYTTRFDPVFNLVLIVVTGILFYLGVTWFLKRDGRGGMGSETKT